MAQTQFTSMLPPTPKLIKGLMIAFLLMSGFSWIFAAMITPKLGLGFLTTFGLSSATFFKGFFWQPVTFLLIPNLKGAYSFSFLINLFFDLYLLWYFGSKVYRHFGPRTTLRLFFIPSALGGLLASLLGFLITHPLPLFGISFALIPLVCAYSFSHQEHLSPSIGPQSRWLAIGLIVLYLLQDISSAHVISFVAHLLVLFFSYLYMLYFHTLRSPFAFTRKFDEFILSKKRRPSSSKIVYLYEEQERRERKMDKTFEKMKNNQKLSVLDKIKLRRYRKKNKER